MGFHLDPYRELILKMIENTINGVTEVCEPTVINDFVRTIIQPLSASDLNQFRSLSRASVDLWGFYYTCLFGRIYSNEFYPDKQQGTEYEKRMRDLQLFWDTYSDNIALFPYNMKVVADDSIAVPLVEWLYEVDTAEATSIVNYVQDVLENQNPAIGYSFSLWSLNALAYRGCPSGSGITMGDGLWQFLEYAGLADAGPDMVLFHEFAHHVQYGNNIRFLRTPEGTRYTELMADALAGYYGHHPRGATFQTKRIKEIIEAMYSVGDCATTRVGHHGTPNQRARAVEFATNLIDESKAKGQKLPSLDFINLFDAAYDRILNG